MWNRREFLRLSGCSAASLFVGASLRTLAAGEKQDRPNIVFIMSDDHAAHALSCYGSRINQTPQLDRLAKEGMRFENCFCTNSICAPSRAVILTGKYSHINGMIDNDQKRAFDGSQQTFPKLLQKKAGYQTAMIGKWHLVSDPTGFDYWNVLPGQGLYHNPFFLSAKGRKRHQGYVTDLITDFSIDWLRNRDQSRPFCLLCQHKAPHRNWQPDEKHREMYKDKEIPLPETFEDDYATRCDAAREAEMTLERHFYRGDLKQDPPAGLSPKELKEWKYRRYMEDYLACIASVDDNVGRLLDFLESEGLAENTIVVYTSDQGFFLGDHGWYDKRFMYEEALRMPLLVRWPKAIKPGSVSEAMVLNLDFAPTFLAAAGAEIPADIQGESFVSILKGNMPSDWRKSMYYHYYEYPAVHQVKRHYGIRTDRYKLIHFYNDIDCWELYDLEKDPHELKNLYGNPEYAGIVETLKKEMAALQVRYKDEEALSKN